MSNIIEQRTVNAMTASILARIICPERDDWSVEAAQGLLNLRFPAEDMDRFHQLLARLYGDQLTESDKTHLDNYIFVNCFITLLHERAKRSLEKASATLSGGAD